MKTVTTKKSAMGKQGGFIMTAELILLSTVMVIGMIVGLVTVRDATTAEMEDVAEAIGQLDQSYAFNGLKSANNTAIVDGSAYGDAVDTNAGDNTEFTFVASDNTEGLSSVTPSLGSSSAAGLGTQ